MGLMKMFAKWQPPIKRRSPPCVPEPRPRFVPEFELLERCELPSYEIAFDPSDEVVVEVLRRAGVLKR
jgi:hypothetical protein